LKGGGGVYGVIWFGNQGFGKPGWPGGGVGVGGGPHSMIACGNQSLGETRVAAVDPLCSNVVHFLRLNHVFHLLIGLYESQ